jgi:hypothetical protein
MPRSLEAIAAAWLAALLLLAASCPGPQSC